MADRRILELGEVLAPERDAMRIGERELEIRDINELSIAQQVLIEKAMTRLAKMFEGETVPEVTPAFETLILESVRAVVVDLDEETLAALSWRQRMGLISFFWRGVKARAAQAKAPRRKSSASPTISSSRDSNASTVATRSDGSASRLAS